MRKTYYRPAGLVYGPDARAIIKQGRGASLGGLSSIAYTLVEVIERDGGQVERRFETYSQSHQYLPPPRGEGQGWGSTSSAANQPPPLIPPHKGEGNAMSIWPPSSWASSM